MLIKVKILQRAIANSVLGLGLLLTSNVPLNALSFHFDYTYDTNNFFADQTRKDILGTAASYFTSFTDDLTAICNPNCGGSNTWTPRFFHPGTNNLIDGPTDLLVPEDTLIIYVGGMSMGGSTLGWGGPGGINAGSGTLDFANSFNRGQTGAGVTDFAPWGGSMSFNSDVTWNFSLNAPSTGQNDFLSVVIHELAHVLGIGTANSWDNLIVDGLFTGATSVSVYGDPVPVTGDGGHWDYDITSTLPGTNIIQEVAMDPNILVGSRKYFTRLDYAGLNDLGWQVPTNLIQADAIPFDFSPGLGIVLLGSWFGFSHIKKRLNSKTDFTQE
jgi:hypothetical protein